MAHFFAIRTIIGILVIVLLAGCGGGGGGADGRGPPMIATGTLPVGVTGTTYAGYSFTVASGGLAPFSWSQTGPLPPGLSFDTSGQLSGVPVNAGTFHITVIVTDSSVPALTGTLPVNVVVSDSQMVLIPANLLPAGIVSYPYPAVTFNVASGGSPPFTWAAPSGTLPPGLTLSSSGTLSGVPTTAGSFAFTVTATDSAPTPETAAEPVTLTINNPAALAINLSPAPPAATNGTAYAFGFGATGGVLPRVFTITAGALPPGLTLDSAGQLTGTPTATGPFSFTVTVSDSASTPATSSAPFSILVSNPPPPAIATTAPPTATVGQVYSFQFQASNGLAPLVWSESGAMPGLGVSLGGLLSGTPSGTGRFPIAVDLKDALNRSAPTTAFTVRISLARPAPVFTSTGALLTARADHTATVLNDGKVLVAGGIDSLGRGINSAELYEPTAGLFATTGNMTEVRWAHTATLLGNAALPNYGKVLIVGSVDATAELYDPNSQSFKATGSMAAARTRPTATLLNSGKVLVAGGNSTGLAAELYDPASGTFAQSGDMTMFRVGHTSTLLIDGRVLITGGGNFGGGSSATAELYNPATGTFKSTTGNMTVARTGHTATRLQDGTVLIEGSDGTADVYDPGSETFTAAGEPLTRLQAHAATLRSDGTVLVVGGYAEVPIHTYVLRNGVCTDVGTRLFPESSNSAEQFAPESGGFLAVGRLAAARDGHTATALANGSLLIVGGLSHALGSRSATTIAARGRCVTPISVTTALSSAELVN